jgi:hypothetical protein
VTSEPRQRMSAISTAAPPFGARSTLTAPEAAIALPLEVWSTCMYAFSGERLAQAVPQVFRIMEPGPPEVLSGSRP